VIDEARHASAWGVTFSEPKIDIDKLRAFKQSVVDKLTGGVGRWQAAQGEVLQGRATLTGPTRWSWPVRR
jgi:dihydrolipoamide dehydrogenase